MRILNPTSMFIGMAMHATFVVATLRGGHSVTEEMEIRKAVGFCVTGFDRCGNRKAA